MSYLQPLAAGAAVALASAVVVPGSLRRRLAVRNHRGVLVPATLGVVLAVGGPGLTLAVLGSQAALGRAGGEAAWAVAGGAVLVFGAGLVDDLLPGGPRGLRGHLSRLLQGKLSPGVLKGMAGLGAGAIVVAAAPRPGISQRACGVLLIAACANLWNGLDVAPGRAVKAFILAAGAWSVGHPVGLALRTLGASVVTAWPDLRERAMLGDSGANLMGFVVGTLVYLRSSQTVLWTATAMAVALNLLAETITLSRLIEAAPPLRWFDRLGRRPIPAVPGAGGGDTPPGRSL